MHVLVCRCRDQFYHFTPPDYCVTGVEYLKEVVINDKLGIAEKLDAQMQHVVDTYQDEWATVVNVRPQN